MDWLAWMDSLLRGAAAALAALLAAWLWRAGATSPAARIGRLLLAGLVVQTLAGHPGVESSLSRAALAPLVGVAVANALLFWALALTLFRADGQAPSHWPLAWLAAVALGVFNVSLGCTGRDEGWAQAAAAAQRLLPLACAAGALWVALRHWRGDLVEPRRRLRLVIVAGGGAYTLVQLALRLGQPGGRLVGGAALLDSAMVAAMLAAVVLGMARLRDDLGWFIGPAPAAPAAPPPSPDVAPPTAAVAPRDPDDDLTAERLQRAMQQDQLWRQGELGIGALAARLGCPEYRLRRVIRDRLGHGHFSAFINSHRIAAAQAALADPARRDQAVLAIALDVGFQSIGPFNRAFKAATGQTPTEFRRQQLADS
ncbi:AraC family transcriptional regulator [Ideonella sp. 4Y16]|uniref:AraC family transcriptional regulator n=1 Tax=Ideonella alba TaxID=2824118 RepID=A0A940YDR3_9BURK|nr:helix-turn-helix domain-containing protein [Ideonella alba]MBQ0930747.1 AraC family transcriptional regulator [Ideonella alba]MBQ0944862.1 AraC family transcriptional regulator [Ideonella alba]